MHTIVKLNSQQSFPEIRIVECDNGVLSITFDNYPFCATLSVPMISALEMATDIICIANKKMKEN